MLLELRQLERDGIELTRDFSMRDSAIDMRFEINRIRSNLETANSVSIMTDALQLAMLGLEGANSKWGPVLHLDGWSRVVDQDRDRFKSVLTKLYKKHWRRGSMMSPEAELGMLLGGSAFMHHFQHKMGASNTGGGVFGGFGNILNMIGGRAGAANPPAPKSAAAGSFTQRPPMRRPNMSSSSFAPPPPPPMNPPPPPSPTYTTAMNEEINSLRRERAVLREQLHQHANASSFGGQFVVMTSSVAGGKRGPRIEEL